MLNVYSLQYHVAKIALNISLDRDQRGLKNSDNSVNIELFCLIYEVQSTNVSMNDIGNETLNDTDSISDGYLFC